MRLFITAFLIILICTLSAVAQAGAAPDHMTITGKNWMVANGADSSPITVTVYDISGTPIPSATVTFRVSAPWAMSPANGVTDGFGTVMTTFQPTTMSGAAAITVNASIVEGGELKSIEQVYVQNIDHSTPATAALTYDQNVSVGSTTTIDVKVADASLNPVDNRNVVETVQFTASGSGDSGFWDGASFVKLLTVPVNSEGIAEVTCYITKSGSNYVDIQPPAPIFHRLITITGVNDGAPYAISEAISPGGYPYPYTKTDGSRFRVVYTLVDQFGNPSGNRGIRITTSIPGEETTLFTNSNGVIAYYYQKDAAGLYTLTATAVDNTSVTTTQTVEFIAADPTTMLLTASPQTMPSRDVKPSITSTLFAKVIDAKGNPVDGELVSFTIWSYNVGAYNQTTLPSIENEYNSTDIPRMEIVSPTNADGNAEITFRPGAFSKDRNDPKYSYTAEGSAIIQATWRDITHTIELQYKNYPFLSVDAYAEPRTLIVNDSVNITIRLKGDGWALQQAPIDVVLLTDRSGSMLFNETLDTSTNPDRIISESPDDRMVHAIDAGKIFVDQMNNTDRIGLVSFGDLSGTSGWAVLFDSGNSTTNQHMYGYRWRAGRDYTLSHGSGVSYYTDDINYVTTHYPGHGADGKYYGSAMATVDLGLAYDKSAVKNIISQMVPNGGTPMRRGIYEAVRQIINDPEILAHKRDDSVKAIVLLTDGAWNTGGDPRGGSGADWYPETGSGSVITWAKNNKIKIFTIALGSEPYKDQLQAYADETGGKAYIANSGLDLNSIYTSIAGELHTEAGVGTTMDLAFKNIEVNGALIPGLDALQYVCTPPPAPFVSTHEFSYNLSQPVIVNRFYDQTADWSDQNLHFDVGTIFIGGVWEANFSMKVKRDGNIKILDSNSTIKFNDGSELPLPDTYITARPDNSSAGPEGIGIWVKDVQRTDTGTVTDSVDIGWNLTYTGEEPLVREDVDVLLDGTTEWSHRLTKYVPWSTTKDAVTMDVSALPSGTWFVRVRASAPDAGEDAGITQFAIQKAEGTPKIKIS
ncbi:MAG TPA: Ig-like domain-containing protein [Methanomicrobiales archaeon]|nr:Ig-like domain-containing protein [Methanomicrobiales archaeon]